MVTKLNDLFEQQQIESIVKAINTNIEDTKGFDGEDAYWYIKCVGVLADNDIQIDDCSLSTIIDFFNWNISFDAMKDKYSECLNIVAPLLIEKNNYVDILNIVSPTIDCYDLPEEVLAYYIIACIKVNLYFNYVINNPDKFFSYFAKIQSENLRKKIIEIINYRFEQTHSQDVKNILDKANAIWTTSNNVDKIYSTVSTNSVDKHDIILLIGYSTLEKQQIAEMNSIFAIDSDTVECVFEPNDICKYTEDMLFNRYKAVIIGPLPDDMSPEQKRNNSVTKITNMVNLPQNCYVCNELNITEYKRAIKVLHL